MEDHSTTVLLVAGMIALVTSGVLAIPIFRLLLRMKSRQNVSAHVPEHAGKQGTPTMGGLIIVAGFLAASIYMAVVLQGFQQPAGGAVLFLIGGFAMIGFVDDFLVPRMIPGKRGLGWTQKLAAQVLIAAFCAWMVGIDGSLANLAILVFFILFFSNAYNFSDGMDWLAGTLLVTFLIGLVSLLPSIAPMLIPYCLALGLATVPFLVLNRPPAKVFMGDVGSLPIGAFLGLVIGCVCTPVLGLAGRTKFVLESPAPAAAWTLVEISALLSIVMIAELVPVPLQILWVKLRKKKLFPFTPIHHAFQKAGWPEGRVVAMFAAIQLAASLIVVSLAIPTGRAIEQDRKDIAISNLRRIQASQYGE